MNCNYDDIKYINLDTARNCLKNITETEFYNYAKQVDKYVSEKTLDIMYLHYLCAINIKLRLRVYLNKLKLKYPDFNSIINDHSLYEYWYETPLHTATHWNNDVELVKLLVHQGSDPNINNYYGDNPFQSFDNYYINPFYRIFNSNGNYLGIRQTKDFTDIVRYYDREINKISITM